MVRKLTLEETKLLSDYCLKNASELIQEAELLLEHKRYARSCALSIVAVEELGKRDTLWRTVNFEDDEDKWKTFWKRFRSHHTKISNIMWDNYLMSEDGREFDDVNELAKKGMVLKDVREATLYADLLRDVPHLPSEFPERLATLTLNSAKQHLAIHSMFKPTEEGIKLATQMGNRRKSENMVEYVERIYGKDKVPPQLRRMAEEWKDG